MLLAKKRLRAMKDYLKRKEVEETFWPRSYLGKFTDGRSPPLLDLQEAAIRIQCLWRLRKSKITAQMIRFAKQDQESKTSSLVWRCRRKDRRPITHLTF